VNLVFDQNISHRIIKEINELFKNSKQVRQLNLEDALDIIFGIMLGSIIL
jgi:predicted nuclease of predicted toxin-antitoxin system